MSINRHECIEKDMKIISVWIITFYLSDLIFLKVVGQAHDNEELCTIVLVKEFSSLPQIVDGFWFFKYYKIFSILTSNCSFTSASQDVSSAFRKSLFQHTLILTLVPLFWKTVTK